MLNASIVALVTPFDNGIIDFRALRKLLDFHLNSKTDGLLLLGTTGESATLSTEESLKIVTFCKEHVKDQLELIVGVCSNNTADVIDKCKLYEMIGIEYFLIISPYYNKTNDDGLFLHFSTIANSINSNIILYNIPSRTNIAIPFNVLEKLSKIKNIIGIKESNDNFKQVIETFSLQSDSFKIYCGNDELILPFLALNTDGLINVSGNILPNVIHDIFTLYKNNFVKPSEKLFKVHISFILLTFKETNPLGIKFVMSKLDMCKNEFRLPLTSMSEKYTKLIEKELELLGMYPSIKNN